ATRDECARQAETGRFRSAERGIAGDHLRRELDAVDGEGDGETHQRATPPSPETVVLSALAIRSASCGSQVPPCSSRRMYSVVHADRRASSVSDTASEPPVRGVSATASMTPLPSPE